MMPSTPRGKNEHDQYKEQADKGHPVLGLARHVILQHNKNRRTDQRSPKRSHPAQDRHDHEIAGLVPAQIVWIGEIVEERIERAGKRHEHSEMIHDNQI